MGVLVEGDAQIDLHTFYDESIRPRWRIANAVAVVEDDAPQNISAPNLSYAAQYLAYTFPCQRFAYSLTASRAIV